MSLNARIKFNQTLNFHGNEKNYFGQIQKKNILILCDINKVLAVNLYHRNATSFYPRELNSWYFFFNLKAGQFE